MNLRFVDWIWRIRGTLVLPPEQSGDDVFDNLDPLFRQTGTSRQRTADTLIFQKKDQAAQDKMSIFSSGVLQIDQGLAGPVLHYHLISRALLFCFLAPLLFLGFAQLTIAVGNYQNRSTATAGKAKTQSHTAKKLAKTVVHPMNPIDKFLGSPEPEKPKKDGAGGADEEDKKPSATPAYVFAAIFAVLYIVGRVLEARLIKALFKKSLPGSSPYPRRFTT